MNVDIKKLDVKDVERFKELIRLFEDVFEMKALKMPEDSYLQKLLEDERFFVFAAFLNTEVVGGLTSYTLQQYYSTKPLVYIYDLAVKKKFQRKGIGKILIKSITNYCREIGAEEVFVQADEVDDYALEFYRSTGATSEKVVHFYYPLNID